MIGWGGNWLLITVGIGAGLSAKTPSAADEIHAAWLLKVARSQFNAGHLPEWLYKAALKLMPGNWYPAPQPYVLQTEIDGRMVSLRHRTDDTLGREAWLYGYYDRLVLGFLREAIKRVKPAHSDSMVYYDIGANIGNHTIFLADLCDDIYCFEPNPKALEILELNLGPIANVRIFPVGLSDRDAELDFMAGAKSNLGSAHIVPAEATSGSQTKIKVRNGDALIKAENLRPPTLLKIDVEGHEAQAVAGLDRTIGEYTPLIVFEMLERALASSGGFADRLRELGYAVFKLSGLDPVHQLFHWRNRLVLTPYNFDMPCENALAIPPRYSDQLMDLTK